MAASSRGLLCLRWTLRIFSSNNVPFNRIKTSALKINTCGIIFSTQRRFYCADAKSDEEETSTDSPPRTLLEAYQTEPVLLHGPRKPVKPLSEEYVQQELEKSRKIRFRTPLPINPREAQWTPESKRAGLIGVKIGMTALWLKDGTRKPVTLVEVKDCQVIQTRISREHGGQDHKTELQVGGVAETQLYKVKKSQYGHFRRFGSYPKKKVKSFPVTENGLLHPGTHLYAAHFYPGQFVKIQGVTIDRGFQGVMKRWKMKGQPASHGQSKTHRKMGATGGGTKQENVTTLETTSSNCTLMAVSSHSAVFYWKSTNLIGSLIVFYALIDNDRTHDRIHKIDPGRIWPGKKMAGHMGNKNCTKVAVKVLRINTKYNVLYVLGNCPGEKGSILSIRDSDKPHERPPPFPTYFPDPKNPLPEDMFDDDVQQFDETIYFSKKEQTG